MALKMFPLPPRDDVIDGGLADFVCFGKADLSDTGCGGLPDTKNVIVGEQCTVMSFTTIVDVVPHLVDGVLPGCLPRNVRTVPAGSGVTGSVRGVHPRAGHRTPLVFAGEHVNPPLNFVDSYLAVAVTGECVGPDHTFIGPFAQPEVKVVKNFVRGCSGSRNYAILRHVESPSKVRPRSGAASNSRPATLVSRAESLYTTCQMSMKARCFA